MVERPPADAVAGLEHDNRVARPGELGRRGQAGEAGADDDDFGARGRPAAIGARLRAADVGERRGGGAGRPDQRLAARDAGHLPALTQPARRASTGNGRSAITAVCT